MATFAVQAVATISLETSPGVTYTRHEPLPTFYLESGVQGFRTEAGAAEVARRILDPFGQYAPGDLVITATEI